jgi:hypothetical protein
VSSHAGQLGCRRYVWPPSALVALPEQRTVRCPLAGFTGRPEAAGHDVADQASPAGAVSAAPPRQEVIMRGAFTARNRAPGGR